MHTCLSIFTGENVRPNFTDGSVEYPNYSIGRADLAFTFDYSDDPRNYRFPLWAFFINWFDKSYIRKRSSIFSSTNHLLSRDNNKPKQSSVILYSQMTLALERVY